MTYDPIDTNDDGVVDADVDNQSVHTKRVNNEIHVPNGDTAKLAEALIEAETTQNTHIEVGDGLFTLTDNLSASDFPIQPAAGFSINGEFPGDDTFTYDSINLADDRAQTGTIIDGGANVLFEFVDKTGVQIEDLGIRNVKHAVRCGAAATGDAGYGLAQSLLRNLAIWEPTDYAFKLFNFQRLNMDMIIGGHVQNGFIHAINDHDVLEGGNSVWRDILGAGSGARDVTNHMIHLEVDSTTSGNKAMNYINMQRPQVISGSTTGTYDAFRIEGTGTNGEECQLMNLQGVDLEGGFKNHIHTLNNARFNHIEYAGNSSASEYDVYLDGVGDTCIGNIKADAYSGSSNNVFLGRWNKIDGQPQTFFGRLALGSEGENARLVPGVLGRRVVFTDEFAEFVNQDVKAEAHSGPPRGEPTTSDLNGDEAMVYVSDGTGSGATGDLMYAVNDAGTIKTSILAARSNAT